MMRLAIDGSRHNGLYRVDCECGANWSGEAPTDRHGGFGPALPIAECVAHIDLEHKGEPMDIRFSHRFDRWLLQYWERVSAVQNPAGMPAVGRRV